MPVISYSSSGSSYTPSSYRYKYSLTDRSSYIPSSSASYLRTSSYRYDLPGSSYSSYRSNRAAHTELSNSHSGLTTPSTPIDKETTVETSNSNNSTVNSIKDTSTSTLSNRPSRYTSTYSYSTLSSAPSRDYSSRYSSRSSDDRRQSIIRDRDNNYLITGGNSSSYASNLRKTAVSGAEVYEKYSVSTYKPSSFERFITSTSADSSKPLVKASSPSNASTALDISKATFKLRQPLNGTSSAPPAAGVGNGTSKYIATSSATTDDIHDGDYHVTATIRIKPKSSIRTHSTSSSSCSSTNGSTNSINNNNNNNTIDNGGADENDLTRNGTYRNGNKEYASSSSIRINGNNNGPRDSDDDSEDDAPQTSSSVDKEPKTNDDDKASYLRVGTSSKGIHSTSPVGNSSSFRSSTGPSYRGSTATLSSSPSSAGTTVQKLNSSGYEDTTDASSRSGGSRKEGLCGLWNIGNTCFMNSIIQCLSHTRELTSYLRNQSSAERGDKKDHKILAEYTKLIKDMWNGTSRSVNPSELKYAFSSKHRMYSGSAQQDAQEFLRFFIDSLHGALNVSVKREPMPKEMEDDEIDARIKANMMWEWYSKVENSLIKDLFVGMLRSTLKCTVCNSESVTFDPFWDLSLPLPSTNSRCKLENCLDVFVKEEVMDGIDQPTCFRCKTRRKCTKSMTIERFPKYLVIHLKRFSETRWSKLTNVIEFPTGERELNLAPYASQDNAGPVYFSLYGISNHMGSTAGGHYIAACKHPVSKEWNEFNDNFVSETSERSLVTSSAYVLFYERA